MDRIRTRVVNRAAPTVPDRPRIASPPASGVFGRYYGAARGLPDVDLKVLMRQLRVALTPRSRLLKARLESGAVVYGKNRPGFGARAVYIYRDAMEPEFEHLERFLDRSGVFFDIGANTGKYAIKAARYYGDHGTVVAIEPCVETLATLQRSVQANRLRNLRVRGVCLAEHKSVGTLWLNGDKPHDFSLLQMDAAASQVSTLTITFDELFEWEGLNRLDYLKVDAVGCEEEVLRGARRSIEKYRPIVHLQATLLDVVADLVDYTGFKAPRSGVKFYLPNEHAKIGLPKELGWHPLAAPGPIRSNLGPSDISCNDERSPSI
jgi:FkbM family methyltransferase